MSAFIWGGPSRRSYLSSPRHRDVHVRQVASVTEASSLPDLGTSPLETIEIAEEAFGFARARVTELFSRLLVETNPRFAQETLREFASVLPHYHRILKLLVTMSV